MSKLLVVVTSNTAFAFIVIVGCVAAAYWLRNPELDACTGIVEALFWSCAR
jgi:hypothetical protein